MMNENEGFLSEGKSSDATLNEVKADLGKITPVAGSRFELSGQVVNEVQESSEPEVKPKFKQTSTTKNGVSISFGGELDVD